MTLEAIRTAIAATPTAALEDIARAAGATPLQVLDALPEGEVIPLPGSLMPEILTEVAGWGEITFIVNTGPVILEVKAPLGKGEIGQGMYNLHQKPICGHLKHEACIRVAFVRRKLFGMETRSLQFYAQDGSCMFKIYLARDEQRQIRPEQIAAFDALEARLLSRQAA